MVDDLDLDLFEVGTFKEFQQALVDTSWVPELIIADINVPMFGGHSWPIVGESSFQMLINRLKFYGFLEWMCNEIEGASMIIEAHGLPSNISNLGHWFYHHPHSVTLEYSFEKPIHIGGDPTWREDWNFYLIGGPDMRTIPRYTFKRRREGEWVTLADKREMPTLRQVVRHMRYAKEDGFTKKNLERYVGYLDIRDKIRTLTPGTYDGLLDRPELWGGRPLKKDAYWNTYKKKRFR